VIHAACDAADHEHSRATLTLIDPSPPETPKFDAEFVAVIWQCVAVGPVVFVTPLLPHATDSADTITTRNRRGRRNLTPLHIQAALQR